MRLYVYEYIYRFAFFPLYGTLSKKEPDQQMIQPMMLDGCSPSEFILKRTVDF